MLITRYLNELNSNFDVPNKTKIRLGSAKFLVIDLTEPLKENVEVYPGDPSPRKEVFSDIRKTGFQHHIYSIGDHNFHPHGDAPSHQNRELQDKGFESFGIDFCFNSACLIDLSGSKEAKQFGKIKYPVEVKKEHLTPFSKIIANKGALIIRTGYDKWLEANNPHEPKNIPYLTKSAADFIMKFKNLKVIGTDSLTIDPCHDEPVHYAHQAFKDKLIVESMVHLYEIPLKARNDFYLQTSPIRIVGATGGPIVAYAFIQI